VHITLGQHSEFLRRTLCDVINVRICVPCMYMLHAMQLMCYYCLSRCNPIIRPIMDTENDKDNSDVTSYHILTTDGQFL